MSTAADSQPEGMPSEDAYALVSREAAEVEAPLIDFRPPMPKDRSIPIGLVGAGGISFAHLDAYKRHGLNVVAIADRHLDRAKARRDQHFPEALATDDIAAVIADPAIRVLDLTPHPESRAPLIRSALEAGKHVLSQKPFVHDLALGEQLAALADEKGLQLAVNQNGRWSPHMAWMREAVAQGLVGTVTSVHVSIQWDHSWVAGTPFDAMDDLILEDFGIHWFDFLVSVIGGPVGPCAAARLGARRLRRRPGLARLRRRDAVRPRRQHGDHRHGRNAPQRGAGSRPADRDAPHRGRRGAACPGGHLVQRWLRRHHGRASRRHRDGRAADPCRTRQSRLAEARPCCH